MTGDKQHHDVARWRKAERTRLIEARLDTDSTQRDRWSTRIVDHLELAIGDVENKIVALYWPIRGEPDVRVLADRVLRDNGSCALPVVVDKASPLEFRPWYPDAPMTIGQWNIPVPERGVVVAPDIVLAPVVGFDRCGYRLGYGGGYFDRTLAALSNRPLAIGVAYALTRIETIFPQPHDLPMSMIVTEEGVLSEFDVS